MKITQIACKHGDMALRYTEIQVIGRNRFYFSFFNVSTHAAVIVKDWKLIKKFAICLKLISNGT